MAFGTTVPMKLSSVSCPITSSIARASSASGPIVPVGKLVRVGWGSLSFSHGIFGGFLRLLAH